MMFRHVEMRFDEEPVGTVPVVFREGLAHGGIWPGVHAVELLMVVDV